MAMGLKGVMRRVGAAAACAVLGAAAAAGAQPVLLIPNSTDRTVGRYDPQTGAYLGDLIVNGGELQLPLHALQGPDGMIYLSDQNADAVFRYTIEGAFVDMFAGPASGLNNVRGLAFQGGNLLVSVSSGVATRGVWRFSPEGARMGDFVTGPDPFAVFVASTGDVLVADLLTPAGVRRYGDEGQLIGTIVTTAFPEQINIKANGNFIVTAFTGRDINEFTLDGVVNSFLLPTGTGTAGRGVAELGNGNILASTNNGVHILSPVTGELLETVRSGTGFRYAQLVGGETPPACPSDWNEDGTVNSSDISSFLTAWLASLTDGTLDADFNGDLLVNSSDISSFLTRWLGDLTGGEC